MNIPQYLRHQCPHLHGRPESTPHLPRRPFLNQQVGLAKAPVESLLCPRSQGTWDLVCPPRSGVCAPPPVLSSLYTQALLTFKARCSGGFSFQGQTPRLRSMTWGSGLSFLWGNSAIFSSLWVPPPREVGVWLYCESVPPAISFWHFLCFWK